MYQLLLITIVFAGYEDVNIFIGTKNTQQFSYGNVYPCVGLPFGAHCISFHTDTNDRRPKNAWFYSRTSKTLRGIRLTHQPSPWINDYNTFSILPLTSNQKKQTEYEVIEAHPHEAILDIGGLKTSITSGQNTFSVTVESAHNFFLKLDTISGKNDFTKTDSLHVQGVIHNFEAPKGFDMYVAMSFSNPIKDFTTQPSTSSSSYMLTFEGSVLIHVSTSYISMKNAESFLPKTSYSTVRDKSLSIWESLFSRFKLIGSTSDIKTFSSTLYRAVLFPHNITEGKKYFSPIDFRVHEGVFFTDMGFWDIVRAAYPFYTLFFPSVAAGIVDGSIAAFESGGNLPQWLSPGYRQCMVGNHANCIIADAMVKNVSAKYGKENNPKKILDVFTGDIKQVKNDALGRYGLSHYQKYGYCEPKTSGSTARALDYALADFCSSRVAKLANDAKSEKKLNGDALTYYTSFNQQNSFFAGKDSSGKFTKDFVRYRWGGPFVEGNALHYRFNVMHDIQGLTNLVGRNEIVKWIDEIFTLPNTVDIKGYGRRIHEMDEMVALKMGQYAHGNEPIHHMLYLYSHLSVPYKSQERLRYVAKKSI
ncbi:hypothetical protein QTN25_010211 [Entamoeba marina]